MLTITTAASGADIQVSYRMDAKVLKSTPARTDTVGAAAFCLARKRPCAAANA